MVDLDTIAKHFCIAAVWADCPEGTHPRTPRATLADAREFAELFTTRYPLLTGAILDNPDYGWDNGRRDANAAFGHDLFLTCAGHGAGFWDRDSIRPHGGVITNVIRYTWEVETEFYRGWLYLNFRSPK